MACFNLFPLAFLFALSATLAGCGDSGGSGGSGGGSSGARSVIASASDCVSFGDEAVKSCAAAIERAVASHEASSPLHANLEVCEKAAGEGKCERAPSGKYRAQLSAFAVTIGSTARAEPLYPTKDGTVGFQTAGNAMLLPSDQSLAFSRLALSVAETHAAHGKKARRRS